jgi:hypothetical protein
VAHGLWLPDSLRYDPNRRVLYGVFPKGDAPSAGEQRPLQILAFQIPALELLGSVELPHETSPPVAILVSTEGTKLLVSYAASEPEQQDGSILSIVDIYDTSAFKRIRSIRETTDRSAYMMATARVNASFSRNADFAPDGTTIYDGLFRIGWTGDQFLKEPVDPLDVLTEAARARLRSYEHIDPGTKQPWLPHAVVESSAGKTLVAVADPTRARTAFWTVDLATRQASPLVEAPASVAHLLDGGRQLLLEEVESSRGAIPTGGLPYKKGKLSIHDFAKSAVVRQIQAPELIGPGAAHRVLCITPDGSAVLFSSDGGLYAIPLDDKAKLIKVHSTFAVDQWTQCLFADQ